MEQILKLIVQAEDDASKVLKGISGNLKSVGKRMQNVGRSMTIATAGITAGLIAATMQAAKFETLMTNVSTLISGDATESIDTLSEGILNLTKTIPRSAEELGASSYAIFSAGITDVNEALLVLEDSSKLGVAGLGSQEQAVNLMTISMNAFAGENLTSAETSDILFKTVKNGITDIAKLEQSFGSVAGSAAAANINFVDVQASTAALSAVTGKTSESQNALGRVYNELTKTGGKLDKELQKNGSSLEELNAIIQKEGGTVAGFEKVRDNLGLTDTEFKNLFGSSQAQGAVFGLLTSGNETYNATLEDMQEGANAIDEAFQKQTETFNNQFQVLKNKLNIVLINLGNVILPLLLQVFEKISPIMDKIIERFQNLSPRTQKIIVVIGALLSALGPFLFIIGSIVGAIAPLVPIFGAIAGAVASVGLLPLIAIVAAIVVVVILLRKNWDKVKKLFEKSKPLFKKVLDFFKKFVKFNKEGLKIMIELGKRLKDNLIEAFEEFRPSIERIIDALKKLEPILIFFFELNKGTAKMILDILVPALKKLAEFIIPRLILSLQATWDIFKALVGIFVEGASKTLEIIATWVEKIVGFFTWLYDKLVGNSIIPDLVNGIISWFRRMWEVVKNIVSIISNFVVNTFRKIREIVIGVVRHLATMLSNVWGWIKERIRNAINNIRFVVQWLIDKFIELKNWAFNIKDGIVSAFNQMKDGIFGVINNVKDKIQEGINKFKEILGLNQSVKGLFSFEGFAGKTSEEVGAAIRDFRGGVDGANGLDFDVPPGFPNDSFPVNVQSGEHVKVTPAGDTTDNSRSVDIGTVVFNNNQDFDIFMNKLAFL